MVKLAALPEWDIVLGLKGTVDFSSWKGIIYARKWPVYTGYNDKPTVIAGNAPFGYIKQQAKEIDASTTAALTEMVNGTQRVYTDEQVSLYYGYDVVIPMALCWPHDFYVESFDCESFA